jgi:glutaredoxin
LCEDTKTYLNKNGYPYTEYIIGKDIERDIVANKFPTAVLLPVIVLDNEYIGGYNDLVSQLELRNML